MKVKGTKIERGTQKPAKRKIHDIRFNQPLSAVTIILIALLLHTNRATAQDEQSIADNFSVNLELKNMHLWHGFVVTPGAMIASSIEYVSANEKFIAGLWGGASFNGNYKEFSYYSTYRLSNNFKLSLISHNNYSDYDEPNIFSYNKKTSPNFVDIVAEYTLSDDVPLTIYWSTILFGNGGDYEINEDGSTTNSFSNYAELRYTLFPHQDTKLTLFAGGAFSFATEKTFYSENANVVNLGLTVSHDVTLLAKKFPVSGTAFWNPESKVGALQLAISLF
ncbi:hypothetical protein [Mangrovibacterium sp.]|uniref:hypothetical protein n=1 Tax=Mangrovibacterium sp. TaxID=1961364 RepID=UPI00356A4EB9